jgi:hypothetical protein
MQLLLTNIAIRLTELLTRAEPDHVEWTEERRWMLTRAGE